VVKASFQPNGIVTLDNLQQDEANRLCSAADVAGKPLDEKTAKAIEEAALKTVKMPADGQFLGDWKKGEALAQSGRGLTWTDDAKTVNGGNCYNCHQIDKEEDFLRQPWAPASGITARFVV
jgi:sulfur-oxidizing protein SoxX